ncbi:MAG: hypothetical protein V1740_01725 [Candidatus Woesearchaeota archaeon]
MFEKIEIPYGDNNGQNALGNNRYFDLKMGALGAVIMGAAVYYVNSEYGIDEAAVAAAKQAAYTFIFGSTMLRLCENIAIYFQNPKVSKVMSVLAPSTLTLGLTYLVHSLKGTPEPLESTVPTLLIAPPILAIWGNRKRNQLEDLLKQQTEAVR